MPSTSTNLTGRTDTPLRSPEVAPAPAPSPRPAEIAPDGLDALAKAIRVDAHREPLAYVLLSDTQQHGE